MFSDCERVVYRKPQIVEVICQLRFPTILAIEAQLPVAFQEKIRDAYPHYTSRREAPPPKLMGQTGNYQLQEQESVNNYQFVSADGRWKVNMTKNFISLATPAYTVWEDFAARLDKILAVFIELYHPALFERIGLRFVNAFSRKNLELEGVPFADLIQPAYLGLMAEEDIFEHNFSRATQDVEAKLPGGGSLRLHVGPGMVKRNNVEDKEVKYILDSDVSMGGSIQMAHVAPTLTTLHTQQDRIFRGAITNQLHNAMGPEARR